MGRKNLTRWDLLYHSFVFVFGIKILYISNVDNNQSEL